MKNTLTHLLTLIHLNGRVVQMKDFFTVAKKFKSVVIQVHDNPDADAIASGFALKYALSILDIDSEIIYYGRPYSKPNLKEMVSQLKIPLSNKRGDFKVNDNQLLVIVDAQRDNSNVYPFHAKNIACIDHHIAESEYPYVYSDIRFEIGSCSTVIANYLLSLTDIIPRDIATALYFGIHMDTNSFVVQFTNLDKDMRDLLSGFCDMQQVTKMIRTSLTFEDIAICSEAMRNVERQDNIIYSNTGDVDDNLLGHISDMLSEIAGIDIVIIFSERDSGFKLSIRSYHDFISAEDIIQYLTLRVGSGGGHAHKSGGFIARKDFEKIYPNNQFHNYIKIKVSEFCQSLKLLVTGKDDPVEIFGEKNFRLAVKRKYAVRYVDLSRHFPKETEVGIKTLEGLIRIPSDHIAIIGPEGEVYGASREDFVKKYSTNTFETTALCDKNISSYGIKLMSTKGDVHITSKTIADLPIALITESEPFKVMSLIDNIKVRTPSGDLFVRNNGYLVYSNINDYSIINDEIFNIAYHIVPNNESFHREVVNF